MQIVFAQQALYIVIALTTAGLYAYPFRFAQALLQRHDLDRVTRSFGCAGLFVFNIAHEFFGFCQEATSSTTFYRFMRRAGR
jgi:hypothetical protein